jgi:hypothetical protein
MLEFSRIARRSAPEGITECEAVLAFGPLQRLRELLLAGMVALEDWINPLSDKGL